MGYGCAERRIHHERPDTPRGPQYVEVPDDYEGPAFCSITCKLLGPGWLSDAPPPDPPVGSLAWREIRRAAALRTARRIAERNRRHAEARWGWSKDFRWP